MDPRKLADQIDWALAGREKQRSDLEKMREFFEYVEREQQREDDVAFKRFMQRVLGPARSR